MIIPNIDEVKNRLNQTKYLLSTIYCLDNEDIIDVCIDNIDKSIKTLDNASIKFLISKYLESR